MMYKQESQGNCGIQYSQRLFYSHLQVKRMQKCRYLINYRRSRDFIYALAMFSVFYFLSINKFTINLFNDSIKVIHFDGMINVILHNLQKTGFNGAAPNNATMSRITAVLIHNTTILMQSLPHSDLGSDICDRNLYAIRAK